MVDAIRLDEDWSHVHVPSILIEHANRLSSRSHLNGMESVVCLANAVDEGLGVILIAVLPRGRREAPPAGRRAGGAGVLIY
jgi:hypothetical protein